MRQFTRLSRSPSAYPAATTRSQPQHLPAALAATLPQCPRPTRQPTDRGCVARNDRLELCDQNCQRIRELTGDSAPLPDAFMADGEAAQQHNLAEIPRCRPVAQPTEHDERNDVARQRRSIEDTVAALVELFAAVPAPEPTIALCCPVWPLGHRRRVTAYAFHRNQPPVRQYSRKADSVLPAAMARGMTEPSSLP